MGNMRRCVILGAAPFDKADALRPFLRAEDMFVVADGGVRLAAALGVSPRIRMPSRLVKNMVSTVKFLTWEVRSALENATDQET